MAKFAEGTTVPVDRTRGEIERLVIAGHKCEQYHSGLDFVNRTAIVQFRSHGRIVRFTLRLPDPQDKAFRAPGRGQWSLLPENSPTVRKRFEQSERTLWRALLLVIKAKLEAVENKISTFEEEFMAQIVLPNDRTVGDVVTPMIDRAYESGTMPASLMLAERSEVK